MGRPDGLRELDQELDIIKIKVGLFLGIRCLGVCLSAKIGGDVASN